MRLSIIVPVYNMAGEEKLNYCLASLIGQTGFAEGDFEIIPVDDCSTDSSPSIIKEYADRYPNLIFPIYSEKNLHQGGARNLGLEAARGEWIGFMDSDDWAAPDMFSKLLSIALREGSDFAGCQYSITEKHSLEIGTPITVNVPEQAGPMTDERKKLFITRPGSMVVKIYKKEVIDRYQLRFPEKTFYEDNQAGPLWMLHFTHFSLLDEPLYYYYQHQTSTVHTVSLDRLQNRMDMTAGLIDLAKEQGLYEGFEDAFLSNFLRLYYANTLFSYMQSGCHASPRFLRFIREGVRRYFPDFASSTSFQNDYDAEQKKMLKLHYKNVFFYIMYDRALRFYRRLRYGKA